MTEKFRNAPRNERSVLVPLVDVGPSDRGMALPAFVMTVSELPTNAVINLPIEMAEGEFEAEVAARIQGTGRHRDPHRRSLILRVATALLAEKPDASVRDIAAAAGMTASNLYAHFSSKDALVRDIFLDGYATYAHAIRTCIEVGGSFDETLSTIIAEVCRLHDEDPTLFRLLLVTQHSHLPAVAPDQDNPVELLCNYFWCAGPALDILDPPFTALAVMGAVIQVATGLWYGRLQGTLTGYRDTLTSTCLAIVRANATPTCRVGDRS